MEILMIFALFATVTFLIYGLFTLGNKQKDQVNKRLKAFLDVSDEVEKNSGSGSDDDTEKASLFKRLFSPLLREFKRSFKKRMPGEKQAKIELKLLQAGSPLGMTPVDFRLLQLALVIIFPILALLYGFLISVGIGGYILIILLSITAAWYLPHYYLKLKTKARNKQALRELPDVIDLLTVSLEAGLGFDSALSKMVSKKKGVLADEFHQCLEEIRLGRTRREALSGIKERLTVDEIQLLMSSILQADKLGIGMVQVLRVQSKEIREQRRQRAEEEAMKAPIKMLFPLVLFIFPSLFIVLLGPALIQFIVTFAE